MVKMIRYLILCVFSVMFAIEASQAQTLNMEKTYFLYYKYVMRDTTNTSKRFPYGISVLEIFEIQPNFTEKKIEKFYFRYKKSIENELKEYGSGYGKIYKKRGKIFINTKHKRRYDRIYRKRGRIFKKYNIVVINSCKGMLNDLELWWKEMEYVDKNIDTFKVVKVCIEAKILRPIR